tara:strand:+ start:300 stop:755 length:456 start_codon:yes stop_codon:yes gene_type:complete
METLKIFTKKSRAFADKVKIIENAGYTLKSVGKLRSGIDYKRSQEVIDPNGNIIENNVTSYDTSIIFEDKEERQVNIGVSLVSKFKGFNGKGGIDEATYLALLQAVITSEKMILDFMKVEINYVEYSKGMSFFTKKNLNDLEKQLEEIGYF